MPFLHGFRRIIYEYQPLVDAVMSVVGLEEEDGDQEEGARNRDDESAMSSSLVELLERESHSEEFVKGISYAMIKLAERGLVDASKVLLQYGADLNFEDPVSSYNPLHIAVLKNQPNMVKLLVEHGADIERRDRIHQSSPLDLASEESERLPCLLTLLDLGADVNAGDEIGKTALHHSMKCSCEVTVDNTENIQILLERGADVNNVMKVGATVECFLLHVVQHILEASEEETVRICNFCMKATELLLDHGLNLTSCLTGDIPRSLIEMSLGYFDLLFPLALLLIQRGTSMVCLRHGDSCWSGYRLIFRHLQLSLLWCFDQSEATELLEQAEVLLDLVRVNNPMLLPPSRLEYPVLDEDRYAQPLLDLHNRIVQHESKPPALQCLCRAFVRRHLQPWPLEEKVKALPLPDRLKDFLLPEHNYTIRPGWNCFMSQRVKGQRIVC